MLNPSDKELDRLSREAADAYEPDDSFLSWSRLEQQLSEQMPDRPPAGFRFGRGRPWIWAAAFVLLSGMSYFLIKNALYSKRSTQNSQVRKQNTSSKTTNGSPDHNSPPAAGTDEQPKENSLQGNTAAVVAKRGESSVKDKEGLGVRQAENNRHTTNRAHGSVAADASLYGSARKAANAQFTHHARNSDESDLISAALSGSRSNPGERERSQWLLPPVSSFGLHSNSVRGNDSLLNRFSAATAIPPVRSLHVNRSFNFGVSFGTDYTDAGGISGSEFGNNLGITAGYYLTNRLSVNTGLIYSNKIFWSPGHGPHTPPVQALTGGGGSSVVSNGYYNSSYARPAAAAPTVEDVNSSVNLLELPLTLRYDVVRSKKNRYFVNAGVSSYFMLKQTSVYYSHNGAGAPAWKSTNDEQKNYWFGVGDFSLGMETEIGRGFSFQIEPFMKLPFQKMGMENLKLNTYGILFSFKYSPVLHRTKK